MTTTTTPNVGADLIAKIVSEAAAGGFGTDFPVGRVVADGEDVPGGAVPQGGVTWVKFVSDVADDFDYDAAYRWHTFQVKRRADRSTDPKCAVAMASMVKLYDRLHKFHAFTGASGAAYVDIVCRTFPHVLEDNYVVFDVVVEFYTPSTI